MAAASAMVIVTFVLAPAPLTAASAPETCLGAERMSCAEGRRRGGSGRKEPDVRPAHLAFASHRDALRRDAQNSAASEPESQDDGDRRVDPSEPDFTLVNLPTGLALPRFGSAFRVTHRFTRSINEGTIGDLFEDLLGIDTGARVGLEYRFAPMHGVQAGVHRSSDRTIEIFGQVRLLRESAHAPLSASLALSVDGANNFRQDYTPSVGAILSRRLGSHGALYFEPRWVHDRTSDASGTSDLFLLGIGSRVRVRPTLYMVAEVVPRVGRSNTGMPPASVALEKRLGGHSFQFSVSNILATTIAPLARERTASNVWHIGFSISRKFY